MNDGACLVTWLDGQVQSNSKFVEPVPLDPYSWQSGGVHPTGMLFCLSMIILLVNSVAFLLPPYPRQALSMFQATFSSSLNGIYLNSNIELVTKSSKQFCLLHKHDWFFRQEHKVSAPTHVSCLDPFKLSFNDRFRVSASTLLWNMINRGCNPFLERLSGAGN